MFAILRFVLLNYKIKYHKKISILMKKIEFEKIKQIIGSNQPSESDFHT